MKSLGLLARKSIYRNDVTDSAAFGDESQTCFLVLYTLPIW